MSLAILMAPFYFSHFNGFKTCDVCSMVISFIYLGKVYNPTVSKIYLTQVAMDGRSNAVSFTPNPRELDGVPGT